MRTVMGTLLSDLKNPDKKPLLAAPLAELSHLPLRLLIEEFGGCDWYFTEMISAGALRAASPYEDFYTAAGSLADRTVFQLAGSDPDAFAAAVERLLEIPGAGIDINMGCSAFTAVQKGWGIEWMRDSRLAADLIAYLRPLIKDRTLSVKMRIGWTADEGFFKEFAAALESAGVDFLTLNPQIKKESRGRSGDWKWVKLLKETVSVPVIGNGNITDSETFAFRAGLNGFPGFGADGFMIGRGGVARPWLFKRLSDLQNGAAAGFEVDLTAVFDRFTELLRLYQPPEFYPSRLSRFLFYFCGNFRFGHRLFSEVKKAGRNGNEMEAAVRGYLNRHPEERFSRI